MHLPCDYPHAEPELAEFEIVIPDQANIKRNACLRCVCYQISLLKPGDPMITVRMYGLTELLDLAARRGLSQRLASDVADALDEGDEGERRGR